MNSGQYKTAARLSLENAIRELESQDNTRLKYAVLELRFSLESLTYSHATGFEKELSNKKLNTWQPKKLLSILLEIDPFIDQAAIISVGIEKEYGTPSDDMRVVGATRPISLKEIKNTIIR